MFNRLHNIIICSSILYIIGILVRDETRLVGKKEETVNFAIRKEETLTGEVEDVQMLTPSPVRARSHSPIGLHYFNILFISYRLILNC